MRYLLEPAVSELEMGFRVVRADKLAAHGRITDNVVSHLLHSAVIVADATGLNPNVFYELGIAHARHRPVVLLVDDAATIPFDTKAEAHLVLSDTGEISARTVDECKPLLVEALREAVTSKTPPGPVAAAEALFIQPDISPHEASDLLRQSISDLSRRLTELEESLEQVAPVQWDRAEFQRPRSALRRFVAECIKLASRDDKDGRYRIQDAGTYLTVFDEVAHEVFAVSINDTDSELLRLGSWLGLGKATTAVTGARTGVLTSNPLRDE